MHLDAFMRIRRRDNWAIAEDSEQLEELRTGDFSTMADELKEVIEFDKPALRYFNLVGRVCKELAQMYVIEPSRRFDGVSEAQAQLLASTYKRNRVSTFMQLVSEKLVAHNSQVIAIDPAGPGRVRLNCFSPFEFQVKFSDPMQATGPLRDAERVHLRVPISSDSAGQVMFGKRVYTKTEAWVEAPGGEKIGLFNDDMSNPFGFIPLVGIRREEPSHGYWAPSLPYDILSTAVAVCTGLSDVLHIASRQCHGREIIIGNGARAAAKQMPVGVDYITAIESADVNDLEHKFIQGDPKIDKYLTVIERLVQIFATNRHISSESLLNSTGITGVAKELELHEVEIERRRVERIHADCEQDFCEMLVDVLRATDGNPAFGAMPYPELSVDFRYAERPQNALQVAQSNELRFRQGLDSVEEFVARTEGISIDEARVLVGERLESVRSRVAPDEGGTPGLDRIDKNQPVLRVADRD